MKKKKDKKHWSLRLLFWTIVIVIVILSLDILFAATYGFTTEEDCDDYEFLFKQTLFIGSYGKCKDKFPKIEKDCLEYDGDLCIRWYEVYYLEK